MPIHGLGDGIAHILKEHLKAREEREGRGQAEAEQESRGEGGGVSGSLLSHLTDTRRHRR